MDLVILVCLLDVPLEADLILGELRYHLLVSTSDNPGKRVVVLGGYGGSPPAQVNHTNLSKVVTLSKKRGNFLVLAIGIADPNLAVTFPNEVHASLHVIVLEVILLDDLLVRNARHRSKLVNQAGKERLVALVDVVGSTRDQIGGHEGSSLHFLGSLHLVKDQVGSVLDDQVFFEHLVEHVVLDSERQGRRDLLQEAVELILLGHGRDDLFEVLADLLAQALAKLDVLHGRVCRVDCALLLGTILVHLTDENRQLSENVGLHNCTCQVNHDHEYKLVELFGSKLITSNDEDRVVEADRVHEEEVLTDIVGPEWIISIIEVIRWHPRNDLIRIIFKLSRISWLILFILVRVAALVLEFVVDFILTQVKVAKLIAVFRVDAAVKLDTLVG